MSAVSSIRGLLSRVHLLSLLKPRLICGVRTVGKSTWHTKSPIGRLLAKTDDVCLHHFGRGGAVVVEKGGGGKMVATTPYLNLLDSYLCRFRFRPEHSLAPQAVALSLLVLSELVLKCLWFRFFNILRFSLATSEVGSSSFELCFIRNIELYISKEITF